LGTGRKDDGHAGNEAAAVSAQSADAKTIGRRSQYALSAYDMVMGMTDNEIERMIELCKAKGLKFKPWEWPAPWDIDPDEPCPYPPHTAGARWWPKAQAIRAKLPEELENEQSS
jgi:hypothetical protein